MNKQCTITLSAARWIELVALINVSVEELEGTNEFIRESSDSIRNQVAEQCTTEELLEAEHEIAVESLLGRTP